MIVTSIENESFRYFYISLLHTIALFRFFNYRNADHQQSISNNLLLTKFEYLDLITHHGYPAAYIQQHPPLPCNGTTKKSIFQKSLDKMVFTLVCK